MWKVSFAAVVGGSLPLDGFDLRRPLRALAHRVVGSLELGDVGRADAGRGALGGESLELGAHLVGVADLPRSRHADDRPAVRA